MAILKILKNALALPILFWAIGLNAQIQLPVNIGDTLYLSQTDSFYYTSESVTVETGGKLIVGKNIEIRFAPASRLNIYGELEINGTNDEQVLFTSVDTTHWGYIYANNAIVSITGLCINNATRFISANYGSIYIANCHVNNTFGGIGDDCIGIHYANYLNIKGCELNGNPKKSRIDAIDCDGISDGIIANNTIKNFEDDGIDIGTGTSALTIENNFIYNCNGGISVGENSIVTAARNIIVSCDLGIQSHTGSSVSAINNTFYNNQKGFECHHGTATNSAGSILLNSCIVSQTVNELYTLQAGSKITSVYSLSDTDMLPGETNLNENPLFVDEDSLNFHLTKYSPCIDAGDPLLSVENRDDRIDIGALEYSKSDTTIVFKYNIQPLSFFPNPSNSYIYLNNFSGQNCRYKIISIEGKTVSAGMVINKAVKVSDLNEGVYFLYITNYITDQKAIGKLVIN